MLMLYAAFFLLLPSQGLAAYVASLIDRTLDWNDIKWLRTICGSMKVREISRIVWLSG